MNPKELTAFSENDVLRVVKYELNIASAMIVQMLFCLRDSLEPERPCFQICLRCNTMMILPL